MVLVSEDSVRQEVAEASRLARAAVRRGNQLLTSGDFDIGVQAIRGSPKRPNLTADSWASAVAGNLMHPSLGSTALVLEDAGIMVAEPYMPTSVTSNSTTLTGLSSNVLTPQNKRCAERTSLPAEHTPDSAGTLAAAIADRLQRRASGEATAPLDVNEVLAGTSPGGQEAHLIHGSATDRQLYQLERASWESAEAAIAEAGAKARELSKQLATETAAAARSQEQAMKSEEESRLLSRDRDDAFAEMQMLSRRPTTQEAQELLMQLDAETMAAESRREEAQVLLFRNDAAEEEIKKLTEELHYRRLQEPGPEVQLWQAAFAELPLVRAHLRTCQLEESAANERCGRTEEWLQGAASEAREALAMARQMSVAEATCFDEVAAANKARTVAMDEVRELRARLRSAESNVTSYKC